MNELLRTLYETTLPTFLEVAGRSEQVSWPLLLDVPDGYASARIKLLVVGQQTR